MWRAIGATPSTKPPRYRAQPLASTTATERGNKMTGLTDRLGPEKVRLGVCCTLWWNDDFPTIDADISFGRL